MKISDEAALRRGWVDDAIHSVRLEGLMVSKEYKAASEEYVAGEISADELVRMTRARFGLTGRRGEGL